MPLNSKLLKSSLQRFAININHLSKRELRLIAIRVVFQATLDILSREHYFLAIHALILSLIFSIQVSITPLGLRKIFITDLVIK